MGLSFIIVENTELDWFIAKKLIRRVVKNADIKTFLTATEAFTHIAINTPKTPDPIIILLDLMMPNVNGFQFLEAFEALAPAIQENYFIVVLTSSLNKPELDRLRDSKTVQMVLDKPINIEKIRAIITKLASYGLKE